MPALRLDSVSIAFNGDRAVADLSLTLAPGEVYALLGPNGAGKTTTLNMILGFLKPDLGSIHVGGIDAVAEPLAARARIAYLPESVMLHPGLTATENLSYFALLAGRRIDAATARRLLADAGLQDDAHDRRAHGFSKGMRQKVGVAIALAKEARLLLLDEPTSGLDASAANDLSQVIRSASDRRIAVLMATHDLFRVKDVAHRLGILHAGRLVEERDAASIGPVELERLYLERLAA
ncbi:ABC transporter ATP-binding protein [Allosphingosinicella deserti]|uniref:ABC transporter ATP-binding protein n=1 Tax=Allosphingosinicella deserti TaxID=2116704 RepID=A0A2P7QEC4_9SPHN|nr:ABC transporter ATP-binding protein [Sphingomonas deserti]PSJ36320.1 ABC transporter ATP-binding protein [Sphingomonas deserti]